MSGQTVVVTGSTKGIGKGLAREFLKRGHNVCVSGRSRETVENALAELADEVTEGARLIGRPCDVADPAEVQALWDFAAGELGSVDIWINNAGFARTGVTLLSLEPDDIRRMVRSNVIGTVNGCQTAVRGMSGQGRGHIYNTYGAGADGRVVPGMIGYGATKSAVRYFTESLIKEMKGRPVKVGMISPGINVTENLLAQMKQVPPPVRLRAMKPVNILGDYVETTTPWIVERILADNESGTHIKWLTAAKVLKRLLLSPFTKRDLFARYELSA